MNSTTPMGLQKVLRESRQPDFWNAREIDHSDSRVVWKRSNSPVARYPAALQDSRRTRRTFASLATEIAIDEICPKEPRMPLNHIKGSFSQPSSTSAHDDQTSHNETSESASFSTFAASLPTNASSESTNVVTGQAGGREEGVSALASRSVRFPLIRVNFVARSFALDRLQQCGGVTAASRCAEIRERIGEEGSFSP